MANIKGIEVQGEVYSLEDEVAQELATESSQTASEAKTSAEAVSSDLEHTNEIVDGLGTQANAIEERVGDTGTPLDTTAQNLIGAVNEIVPRVQSREIVTIVTEKAESSDTSELYPADLASAGNKALHGSYIVTVHRDTSSSMTWFIGWIDFDSRDFYDCSFHKLDGQGYSLAPLSGYNGLCYTGGDENEVTTWIFQPIGDTFTDY